MTGCPEGETNTHVSSPTAPNWLLDMYLYDLYDKYPFMSPIWFLGTPYGAISFSAGDKVNVLLSSEIRFQLYFLLQQQILHAFSLDVESKKKHTISAHPQCCFELFYLKLIIRTLALISCFLLESCLLQSTTFITAYINLPVRLYGVECELWCYLD